MQALRSLFASVSAVKKAALITPLAPTALDTQQLTQVSGGLPRVGGWDETDPPVESNVSAELPRVG